MMHDNAKEHQSLVPQTYVCKTNDTRCIKKEFSLQLYKLVVSSHRKLIITWIANIRPSKYLRSFSIIIEISNLKQKI